MVNANTVFMFPGQGSQCVGMGKDLAEAFPEFRQTLNEASEALGLDMAKLCFEDASQQLNLTEFTQPALLTVSTGIARILKSRVGVPTLCAGHSLGEYSALVALGALAFSDAVKAVRFRGQAMQRAVPVGVGAMTAYVGSKCDAVVEICRNVSTPQNVVEVVNFNSASQLVLSGHKVAVESVGARIVSEKLGRAIPLPVSAPFHSSLMQPAAKEMSRYLESVTLASLQGALVANVDAKVYRAGSYSKDLLVKQLASAVLWTQSLATLKENGASVFVEVGPGGVLQGLAKKTLEGVTTYGTTDASAVNALLKTLETTLG